MARLRRLAAIKARLELEALALYRPLPKAVAFHESEKQWRIAGGSNRSGKTFVSAVEAARAMTGIDPKYPKTNGRALFVGRDGDHLAKPMALKLLQPGQFKLIKDEQTRKWRSLMPDPADPTKMNAYDAAYREQWRDAPVNH